MCGPLRPLWGFQITRPKSTGCWGHGELLGSVWQCGHCTAPWGELAGLQPLVSTARAWAHLSLCICPAKTHQCSQGHLLPHAGERHKNSYLNLLVLPHKVTLEYLCCDRKRGKGSFQMTEGLFPHWWKEAFCAAYIPSCTRSLGQPSGGGDRDVVAWKNTQV